MDLIEIEQLSYRYPTSRDEVLRGISLSIKKGQFCSVIGPNGAGKTTLCNAIRGFVPKFFKGTMTGEVRIDGVNLEKISLGELAPKIGFVFQNPFTQISGVADTVYEELYFGLENLGVEREEIRRRVEEVMALTKIEYLRDRNPFELSGGQQQRVALASIIVMDPDILVIDEPTSQLDPEGTEEVFEIIRLMKEKGKTIVLVEHKMELVAEYSDRVIVLDQGSVLLDGTPEEVFSKERLLDHGTALPQYAMLGLEMNRQSLPLERIPVTERQAKQLLQKLISSRHRYASLETPPPAKEA